jgi:subtilisin family serine protease
MNKTKRKMPYSSVFFLLSFLFLVITPLVYGVDNDGASAVQATSASNSGIKHVIIELKQPAIAAYKGTISGYKATSIEITKAAKLDVDTKESRAYRAYLEGKQKAVELKVKAISPTAKVTYHYFTTLNAFSASVPESVVSQLSKLSDVLAVYEDKQQQPDTTVSPALIGANTAWTALGGYSRAGEGIIVGIIDTGIWPEHPSFSDPDPSGKSYTAPPRSWKGTCETPRDFSAPITCSNKLIGARSFLETYKDIWDGLPPGDFDSPRDSEGHGTHVASTAAGNYGVEAIIVGNGLGNASGIAPRAYVAMYRVCSKEGCWESDSIAAIEKAIEDGVDVLNYSISGDLDTYADPVDIAFLNAYRAGVFIATSAGNAGPVANTVAHRGGWMNTVAATTNSRTFSSTITLTGNVIEGNNPALTGNAMVGTIANSAQFTGSSLTTGIMNPAEVVVAANFDDDICLNPFAPGTFTGKIVACMRGNNGRINKGYNVLQGGAVGMILYNAVGGASNLVPDVHLLPAIHIDAASGVSLLSFLADNPGATATFPNGTASDQQPDMVSDFSSRGGKGQGYGISKPDMGAPGATILAGFTPEPMDTTAAKPGEFFTLMDGTSMASPHVAGAGAILKNLNPTWTPGQIKSALMTTALTNGVVKEEDGIDAGPFDCGSGRIDLTKAGRPGITFEASGDDFITYKTSLWRVNYPSVYIPYLQGNVTVTRTARSTLPIGSTWTLTTEADSGLVITVPSSFKVTSYAKTSFSIQINGAAIPPGGVRHGTIYLSSGSYLKATGREYQLHIPVTVVKRPAP